MVAVSVRSAPASHFATLAREAPRTADAAFEALRHANGCATQLDAATNALGFLRDLLDARVTVDPPRLFGGFFASLDDELEPHERKLAEKTRIYAELCATVETIDEALASAKAGLERMGRASVRVMRDLRAQPGTSDTTACRHVVAQLVKTYEHYTDQLRALRAQLTDTLPNDLAARLAR
jgi:hypothetical protein